MAPSPWMLPLPATMREPSNRRRPRQVNGIASTFATAHAFVFAALLLCIAAPTRSTAWQSFTPSGHALKSRTAARSRSILTLHADAGREDAPRRLRTDPDVQIGKLAGAIKFRVKKYGHAEVSGMGSKSIFRLLKSIDLASKYIQDDDEEGKAGAMAASVRKETTARGNVLHIFDVQEVEAAPQISESDLLRVGSRSLDDEDRSEQRETLVNKLVKSLEDKGQVALTGLGQGAAINIIEMLESVGSDMVESESIADTLTLLPWWENVQTYRGEKRRLVAYCQKRPGFANK